MLGRRSIVARSLAALALAGVCVAVFAVVSAGTSEEQASTAGDRKAKQEQKKSSEPTADTYTVIPGDTLSGIADKSGVRLGKLQRLNPDVDSESLNAGQVIKLKPG